MNAATAPPSRLLTLTEPRAAAELGLWALTYPLQSRLPRGDGHAIIVIPGFGATDRATWPLRRHLERSGYATSGWGLGRNLGSRAGMAEQLRQTLATHCAQSGGPVSLIGWSLGGVFARELARHAPDQVRQVITLGSPIRDGRATTLDPLFRRLNGGGRPHDEEARKRRAAPPPVPCTAIYTRGDGIVNWRVAREPDGQKHCQNIRIAGSHIGLAHNPLALYVISDRLAQAAGEWRPFRWFQR